jgi:hypothetical protein
MRMIARGGAIAAMGYLPVEPAAEDKPVMQRFSHRPIMIVNL